MSESVACMLEYMDNEKTKQTRLFIRMIDHFFDYMNVKSPLLSQMKRKDSIAPYRSPSDHRFKVRNATHTHTRMHTDKYKWSVGHLTFGWKGKGVTLMPVVYILTP